MSFGWIDDRSMIQPSRNSTISNSSSSRRSRYYLSDSVDENYNERPTRKKQYDTWTSGYGFDEEEEDEEEEEERLHQQQQQQQQSQQNCRRNQRKRNGKHNSISSLPILPSASLRSILKSSSSTENLICSDYLDKRNRIEDTFDAVPPGVKAYWMREQQLRKSLKQGKKVQFHENSEANKRRKQQYTREVNDMSSDELESELESIFFRGEDEVYRDKRPATPVSRRKINNAGKTPSKDQQNFPKGSKALHNNNNNNNHNNNITTNHNNNNNNNNNNKNHRNDAPPQINDTGYMEQDSSNQVNCPFKRSYTKMGVDPNEDVVQFNALRRKSIHHINSFARSSARSSQQQSNFGYRMSQRMRGPIADPRASLRDFPHPSVSNHVHMQQLRKPNNRDCDLYGEQQRKFSVRSSSHRSSKRHNNRSSNNNMGNNANQSYLPKSQSQYMEELEYESSNEPANSPFQRSYSTREYGMRQNGRRNHHHHQHHHNRSSVRQGNHNHQNRMAGLPNNGAISNRQGELSDSGVMKNSMRRKSVFNSLQNSVPGDQQTLATESSYIGSVNSINTLDSNCRNNMNNNNNNNNTNINSNGFSDCSRENEYDTVEEFDNNVSSTDNREPRAMEDSFGPLPRPIMPVMEENNDDPADEIQPNVEERKGWSYLAGSLAQEAVAVALRRSARRSTKYLSDKSEVEGSVKSVSIKSERQTKRQKPVPARIGIPSQIVPVPKKEIQQAFNTQSSSYPSSNTNVYQTPKQESYNSISFQGTTQNHEGMEYTQKPNISKGAKFQPDSSPSLIPLQSLAAMIPPVEESGILPQFPSMNCSYNLPLGVVRPQPVILAPLPVPPNILPKPVKKPEMNIEDESAGDIILAPVVNEGPKTEEPKDKESKKEKAKKQANSSKTAECEEIKNDENNVKKEGKKKKKKKRKKKKKGKKNNKENAVKEDKEKTEKKKEEVKEKVTEKEKEKVNKKEKEKNKKNSKKQSPNSKKDAKTESKLDTGDSDGTDAFQTPPSSLKDSKSSGGSGGHKTYKSEGKQGKTKAKSNNKHSKDKKDLEKKTGNSKAEQQQGKNSCDSGQSGEGQENKTEEARGQGLSRLTRKISHRVGSWGKEIKRLLSIKVEQPPPSPPKASTEGNNSVSSEETSKNGNNNKQKSKNTKKPPPVHKKSLSDISSAQENQDEFSKAGNSSCDVYENDDDDDDNDNDVDIDDDVLNFCDEGKTTQIMNWLHEMYSTHSSDSRVSPVMAATTVATQF
ncbi:hypothetical protein Ahia01_000720200 [Argonauta hians]